MGIVNVEALKSQGCELWWPGNVSSANSPKQIMPYGDVKQILPFPGAGIGMFDGSNDYIEVDGWYTAGHANMFGGNFTIECWVSFSNISVDNAIVSQYSSSSEYWTLARGPNPATLFLFCTSGGSTRFEYSCPFTPTLGQLYHIVVERSESSCLIFINGISQTVTKTTAWGTTPNISAVLRIGRSNVSHFNGSISELRISKGIARYTSNFTPSRRQLESDSYTTILQHFLANGTTFTDSSSYASSYTITAYGDAKQLCSPCGSGVAYFDGTGDYITIPDSDDWNVGTNFTVEAIAYAKSVNANDSVVCGHQGASGYGGFVIDLNSAGKWAVYTSQTGSSWIVLEDTITASLNTFYHLAFCKNGSNLLFYVNGILKASAINTNVWPNYTNPLYIGDNFAFTQPFNGYISEIRISNTARYTTNFTPSTTPFAPDPYTKLLLHMDGVGNAFYDSSDPPGDNGFPILPDGVTVTPNGTFAVEKMKDGRNIWKFDGSTNYITISDHASWWFSSSPFTICFWIKTTSLSGTVGVMGQLPSNGSVPGTGFCMTLENGEPRFYWYDGSVTAGYSSITGSLSSGVWAFVVFVSNGTAGTFYVNGINGGSVSINNIANSSLLFYIGACQYTSWGKVAGNIKDLMIFKKALTQDQIAAIMAETYIY